VSPAPQLAAHGLAVAPPAGWEARIARRRPTHALERTFPVVHLASFPLPEQRDDFGGNITSGMRSSDVFVVLFEYDGDAAHQPLFESRGIPRVDASMFSPNRLQRRRPGQLGCQLFFSDNGRPFCLYVVAGSRASLPRFVSEVNEMLAELHIGASS
jgi:hypothetical protein